MTDLIRVLHVEDQEVFAELTATYLEDGDANFEVVSVPDAQTGLERLAAEDIDCVVSDYGIGEMDGIALLRDVRADFPDLPFILFTGKGSEEVASEAISQGVTEYLQKGTETEQYEVLANRIENVVTQQRAEQRAERQARILRILREVNVALLDAQTTAEIEASVTEILAVAEPYRRGWFGEYDPDHHRLVPRTAAGTGEKTVQPQKIRDEHEGDGPPLWEAEDVVVVDEPPSPFDVWGEPADRPEEEALAVLPVDYHGTRYGMIALYADADTFDADEVGMLAEIAGDTAQAYHAARTLEDLRQHQTVVEAVPEGVFLLDEEGCIDLVNEQAAAMFDRTAAEATGEPFPRFVEEGVFDAEIIEWYVESLREMLSSKSDHEEAIYVTDVQLNGETRTVEIHLTLRPYEEEYRGTVGIIRDVTGEG